MPERPKVRVPSCSRLPWCCGHRSLQTRLHRILLPFSAAKAEQPEAAFPDRRRQAGMDADAYGRRDGFLDHRRIMAAQIQGLFHLNFGRRHGNDGRRLSPDDGFGRVHLKRVQLHRQIAERHRVDAHPGGRGCRRGRRSAGASVSIILRRGGCSRCTLSEIYPRAGSRHRCR